MRRVEKQASARLSIENIALDFLPKNVRFLVDSIGFCKAIALVDAFPGVTISLSKGIRSDGQATFAQVAEIIGEVDARKLADSRGGEPLYLPKGINSNILREARDEGIRISYDDLLKTHSSRSSAAILAIKHGLCDRQIFNIVNNVPKPLWKSENLSLFA